VPSPENDAPLVPQRSDAMGGTELGAAYGMQPIYARYNTGRRVHTNGLALARALERHASGADRIVLLGHSMGGLVARSACHQAAALGHRWLAATDWVISLGTPHQGAPLAKLGAAVTGGLDRIDLPAPKVLARLLAARSAGVRDLELGELLDRDPDIVRPPRSRRSRSRPARPTPSSPPRSPPTPTTSWARGWAT
jgi:pimeloyl-ACP methyl ester carboxylesterase